MSWSARALLGACLVAIVGAACTGGPPADPPVGAAVEAWCRGFVVDDVVTHPGTVFFIAPAELAQSAEGWGPQALSVSVDRGFSPQVTYLETPSISLERDKVTRSLQKAVSFSLTTSTNLVAATSVLVPTDAYYRIEAYPQYEAVTWDLHRDPCGAMGAALVTSGTVYRPVGIYFRVMVFVGGAWNALAPPSPSEIPLPASLGGVSSAPAPEPPGAADAGADDGGDGGS